MQFPKYFEDDCFIQESPEVIDRKVAGLLAAMTPEEKAGLCHGWMNPDVPGQVGNGGYLPGIPSLGVPEIRMFDGPAGVTSMYETTGLPCEELLASTFSVKDAEAFGKVTGSENRMISGNMQLGAEADLVRTTHFNRTRDMLGEDPLLAGEMITALTRGIQDAHVMTVLKHFAGYVISGNPADSPDTVIDEQTMRELYLAPFEQAIHEGSAAGVMTAYNRINGPYAANAPALLQDVLRRDWGFEGLTMCDWGGNHSFTMDKGMDMEMPMGAYNSTERILKFLESGRIGMALLDETAGHVLKAMGMTGYLSLVQLDAQGKAVREEGRTEPIRMPDHYADQAALRAENAAIAQTIAARGAVLLKNDNRTLPLTGEDRSVAMIGTGALYPVCGYGQERSYGTLSYMKPPAQTLSVRFEEALPEQRLNEEKEETCQGADRVIAVSGLNLAGYLIPGIYLSQDAEGTLPGLVRTWGITGEDGYRPPLMSQGGGGEEFFGTAARDAESDDDEGSLDFAPTELFMPGSDAADMPGHETGSLCCVDPMVNFTCGEDNKTWKNGPDGTAFARGDAYTWKGYLYAPETGEYQINLQAIGGIAVLKMDTDGTGMKDIGSVKLREGTQWPWGNLVCTPEGMEICHTRVLLEGGRRYPLMLYVHGMLDKKDMQVRLAWVTPDQRAKDLEAAKCAAETADKTVVFLHSGFKVDRGVATGGLSFDEGTDLSLDAEQLALLTAVSDAAHAHGHPIAAVVYDGSAMTMGAWIDRVDALMYMWMPGQGGADALADLLTGKVSPSGRLPQSLPACNEDTPVTCSPACMQERWLGARDKRGVRVVHAAEGMFTGYRWHDRQGVPPLFAFGHGLSYTTFAYDNLSISEPRDAALSETVCAEVSFDVRNTGDRTGDEIVQVYLGGGEAPNYVMMPDRKLCAFARLENILPGEVRHVCLPIRRKSLCYWDMTASGTEADHWKTAAGTRKVQVGASSADIRLEGTLTV